MQDDACEQIEGISLTDKIEDTTTVTSMENDATLCATVKSAHRGTIFGADDMNDLRMYLARPQVYDNGAFGTGTGRQTAGTIINNSTLSGLVGTVDMARMTGARGFRATFCFKLVVSATPFHQGVAALSWQYGVNSANTGSRSNFFYQTPNIPHVKLDLAEETSVELRVPYLSHLEYFPLTGSEGGAYNYGTVAVTRLTDFRITAPQVSARYILYVWLEDVELIAARTYATTDVLLQAGGSTSNKSVTSKVSAIDKELKSSKLVSKTLGAVSKLTSSPLGGALLGPVSGPVSWMTNVLSKGAAAMGYSKPVDETIVKRKLISGYGGETHVDMPASSFKAGPFQTNKLQVGSVGGTDVDEMDFDYVFSKPAYIYRKVWASTVASGDLLYNCILSPSCMWFRDNAGSGNIPYPATASLTTNAIAPSHLCYVGNSFKYWRGGFKFTLKFSKSKMHGGRVILNFTPETVLASDGPVSTTQPLPTVSFGGVDVVGYSKVVEIKDNSVVEFEIPYVSTSPYLGYYSSMGNFSVHCVAPLVTPSGATSSIDMAVFVEALPDFQFAALTSSLMDGFDPSTVASTPQVYLQAGGVSVADDASQVVIGEQFRSLKQMIMVPESHVGADKANGTITNIPAPYWFRKVYIAAATPISNTAQALWFGTRCSRLLDMYTFCNGSTEVVLYDDGGNSVNTAYKVFHFQTDSTTTLTTSGSLYAKSNMNSSSTGIYEYLQNAVRINFPAYSRFQRLPIPSLAGQFTAGADLDYTSSTAFFSHIGRIAYRNNSGATRRLVVQRAAGDDATMGQYVGPPLVVFFQSTATVTPNPSSSLV